MVERERVIDCHRPPAQTSLHGRHGSVNDPHIRDGGLPTDLTPVMTEDVNVQYTGSQESQCQVPCPRRH